MDKVNELTRFLTDLAERTEKTPGSLYAKIMHTELAEKLRALDVEFDTAAIAAIRDFISQSFISMVQDSCALCAMLMLEIKNQKEDYDNNAKPADIVELSAMATEAASGMSLILDVVKQACKDIDWQHMAERIYAAGKAAEEEQKKPENPFSAN